MGLGSNLPHSPAASDGLSGRCVRQGPHLHPSHRGWLAQLLAPSPQGKVLLQDEVTALFPVR